MSGQDFSLSSLCSCVVFIKWVLEIETYVFKCQVHIRTHRAKRVKNVSEKNRIY